MSHFTVLVALRPTDPKHIYDALTEALAPFDENRETTPYFDYETGQAADHWLVKPCRKDEQLPAEGDLTWRQVAAAVNRRYDHTPDSSEYMHVDSDGRAYTVSTYNPLSKWDWWVIGGRWTGYFTPLAGRTDDDRLILGEPGAFGKRAKPGRVDGGPRGLLDFEQHRQQQADEAGIQYDQWQALVAGLPEALPWRHFLDRHKGEQSYTIDEARRDYGAQPRVRKSRESHDFAWLDDVIEAFAVERDAYTQQAADRAVPGYAFLGLDGAWQAPGEMGWFGMSSDSTDDRAAYYRRMNEQLDALDPATLLVAVDCHI